MKQVYCPAIFLAAQCVCLLGLLCFATGCPAGDAPANALAAVPRETVAIGSLEVVLPQRVAQLDKRFVPECSGLVASKKYPGVFWTHSDSDSPATIVAIHADGTVVKPPAASAAYRGITLTGAVNNDWEAITTDDLGRLIIADMGNNHSSRRNLCLLAFPEPDPQKTLAVTPKKIAVRYADQTDFPDKKKRFDSEAAFVWNGAVYVLTKRWSDTWTVLYRLNMTSASSGVFEPVTSFDSHGLVTDASISPDGRLLAILTYHGLWAFVLPSSGKNPLSGSVLYRPLQFPMTSWQAEALAFRDNDHVLIGTEQGELYVVALSRLAKVR
ncbi:MAG: hypothetical protein LBV28_02690 [Puniceicoccales bacterium]|nr:hypothetical protein [Puniceicoccales bacterium]